MPGNWGVVWINKATISAHKPACLSLQSWPRRPAPWAPWSLLGRHRICSPEPSSHSAHLDSRDDICTGERKCSGFSSATFHSLLAHANLYSGGKKNDKRKLKIFNFIVRCWIPHSSSLGCRVHYVTDTGQSVSKWSLTSLPPHPTLPPAFQ